jgi:putative MATE family efflux protein
MRDLTQGSITRHLLGMAAFIAVGLIVQTLYFLIDLYFVSRLGKEAVAGVSAAGASWMLAIAASQIIAVGSLSLIARAMGARSPDDARLVFNQSLGLALVFGVVTLSLGWTVGALALGGLGADPATTAAGRAYLFAFVPALALMFPTAAISAGLRAAGVVGPPMAIASASIALNALLAPMLIAGWGPAPALGVAGAGLASSVASLASLLVLTALFPRMQTTLRLTVRELAPQPAVWRRIAAVGLPASGEFLAMFVYVGLVYWVIRDFGSVAQAGFGIGMRVMQSIFLPAMAIAFAAAPIAGQNFGARDAHRVRATFRQAALIGSAVMFTLTLLCHIAPEALVAPFTEDAAVAAVAADYLKIISWNFVAVGLVFACSGLFQALGDTRPALVSSATRLVRLRLADAVVGAAAELRAPPRMVGLGGFGVPAGGAQPVAAPAPVPPQAGAARRRAPASRHGWSSPGSRLGFRDPSGRPPRSASSQAAAVTAVKLEEFDLEIRRPRPALLLAACASTRDLRRPPLPTLKYATGRILHGRAHRLHRPALARDLRDVGAQLVRRPGRRLRLPPARGRGDQRQPGRGRGARGHGRLRQVGRPPGRRRRHGPLRRRHGAGRPGGGPPSDARALRPALRLAARDQPAGRGRSSPRHHQRPAPRPVRQPVRPTLTPP